MISLKLFFSLILLPLNTENYTSKYNSLTHIFYNCYFVFKIKTTSFEIIFVTWCQVKYLTCLIPHVYRLCFKTFFLFIIVMYVQLKNSHLNHLQVYDTVIYVFKKLAFHLYCAIFPLLHTIQHSYTTSVLYNLTPWWEPK